MDFNSLFQTKKSDFASEEAAVCAQELADQTGLG